MRRAYREDIDWLRAIAVLAVVAFHFESPAVFAGFVGVDIFFVIYPTCSGSSRRSYGSRQCGPSI